MTTTANEAHPGPGRPVKAPGRSLEQAAVVSSPGFGRHCRLQISGDQGTIKLTVHRTVLAVALADALEDGGTLRLSLKLEPDVIRQLQADLAAIGAAAR